MLRSRHGPRFMGNKDRYIVERAVFKKPDAIGIIGQSMKSKIVSPIGTYSLKGVVGFKKFKTPRPFIKDDDVVSRPGSGTTRDEPVHANPPTFVADTPIETIDSHRSYGIAASDEVMSEAASRRNSMAETASRRSSMSVDHNFDFGPVSIPGAFPTPLVTTEAGVPVYNPPPAHVPHVDVVEQVPTPDVIIDTPTRILTPEEAAADLAAYRDTAERQRAQGEWEEVPTNVVDPIEEEGRDLPEYTPAYRRRSSTPAYDITRPISNQTALLEGLRSRADIENQIRNRGGPGPAAVVTGKRKATTDLPRGRKKRVDTERLQEQREERHPAARRRRAMLEEQRIRSRHRHPNTL